ncbi:hypothetical protein CYMTET_47743 [Cymbomonas tetramitiformis]|uniref:Uncharacterized protein n=1 Tax=Cymbomonas tetramitiformis TaxID=36881 RepID=A0AAE0BV62_9CHLO|nr:hypothetical protein CYMTET_47743 [Cymbomonas tetramitiformis]|eukprot:gene409-761_t
MPKLVKVVCTSHPWMTHRAKIAMYKNMTPRTARRVLDPLHGDLSGEIIRMAQILKRADDTKMYDHRPTIRDPRNSERMTRSLSRELEFYAEMCAERVMRHDLKGRPCFIDHMNVDERAGLLLCFASVIAKRADQLSSPVCVTNDERQQLRNLLKDGNAAALDGEIHVVRASVFAYSERITWLRRAPKY